MSNVVVDESSHSDSMLRNGYIVICALTAGDIFYGGFSNKETAIEYGSKLINARVVPLYFPTLH